MTILRECVLLCVLAGCDSLPESMSFDHSDGTGAGLSDCICAYYDGTDNDFSLQLTCTTGNDTIDSVSLFIDPRDIGGEGEAKLIFIPTHVPANYVGGGLGQLTALSTPTDASKTKVIRNVDGIEIHWPEQDACNVAQPCEIDSFHLLAGSVSDGHGGCEDYYSTLALSARN